MLGIGIIGAGTIARVHAQAYAKLAGCRVMAVAEVDEARGRAFAEALQAVWYPDWGGVLDRQDVQAVSVCLPHSLHAPAVLDAAAAGKHVLCEKPIATTLEDADRMIEACARAGVVLMVGHTHRFRAEHIKARELLEAGAIGCILQVRDVILAGRDVLRPLGWRGTLALSGGGVFMDNGVHAADRLRWWLGDEVAWVVARTGRATGLVEGEDHGVAFLAFRHGVVATMEQALAVPKAAGACYAEFTGSEGVLRVDTWQRLRITTRGRPWEEVPLPPDAPDGFDAEIAEFVAAIREERAPAVTGEDGRAALEIIQAIYRSARADAPVRLPLPTGEHG